MERIGPSEKALLDYLAATPRSRHGDMSTALNETKGNLTNRLRKLKDKGLIVLENRVNYSLTEKGIIHLITLGGDVHTIIKNYWYTQPWVKKLKALDEVLTDELPFWPGDRDQVMGQLYLSLDAITRAGVTNETVARYTLAGVFKAYTDRKRVKGKKLAKIGKRLVPLFGGMDETLKAIGYNYKL